MKLEKVPWWMEGRWRVSLAHGFFVYRLAGQVDDLL